ncbi:MAG: response regulator [Pseudomonadales bacterium]|nr:response regulator [Pseudomonadales bacterium]
MTAILLLGVEEVACVKITQWLKGGEYQVYIAPSVDENLAFCRRQVPDVFFVDVGLFVNNGAALRAKLEENNFQIPVICYANAPQVEDVIAAFRCGAADFITYSGLSREGLLSSFSLALEKTRTRDQHLQQLEEFETENRSLRSRFDVLNADQEAGRFAQLKLFPVTPFLSHQYHFSHRIIPSLLLSGDFIDYFDINKDECAFYLADVSGHGASSAFVTVLVKCLMNDILKSEPERIRSPAGVLGRLNQELIHMALSKHVAMLYGVINRKNSTLVYSVAAHYPLPILSDGENARFIGAAALPLGVTKKLVVQEYSEPLPKTFSLVMFTDGIMEVLPQESLLEKEQGLLEMVGSGCMSLSAISSKLALDHVENPNDDIGMLVIEG